MTNMKKDLVAQSVKIGNDNIDNSAFGSLLTTIGKQDEKLTKAANAAAVQLVVFNNPNWVKRLFEVEGMRKVNGDLTKRAAELRDYIKAHAPITFTLKDGELTIAPTKNKKNKGLFFNPVKKDENGAPLKIDAAESPDFILSLADWRNMQAPVEQGPKNKKAATLANQLETMAALLSGEKESEVVGKAAEFEALAILANRVADIATAAKHTAAEFEAKEMESIEKSIIEAATGTAPSPTEKRADTDRKAASAATA